MNKVAEQLATQLYAVVFLELRCNHCDTRWNNGQSTVSLAMYQAVRDGWTINQACQVSCPKCRERQGA